MKYRMYRLIALMLTVSMMSGIVACGKAENAVALGTEMVENTESVEMETEEVSTTETAPQTEITESTESSSVSTEMIGEEPTPETEVVEAPAYTITAMDAKTMYAKQSVNVRKGPSADYEKVGSLNTNDEVIVIGQANETSWYQIQYNGSEAFVSNNYLSDSKVEIQVSGNTSDNISNGTNDGGENSTSGGHISWTGSTSLPTLGITIPVLNSFNSPALDNYNGWAGDESTQEGWDAMQTIYDIADTIEDTVKNKGITCDTGFSVDNNAIEWCYTTYGSMNDFELWRNPDSDIYTLEVNTRLCDGKFILDGTDIAPYSRDILLYLCSVVSSTPDTLYANLYEDLEGNSFISDSSWSTIGDCKVKWDSSNSYENHVTYIIKSAN